MKHYIPIEKKVIKVNELQVYLDISKPFAYQLIKTPGFPLYCLPTIGNRNMYRIPVRELNEWLSKNAAKLNEKQLCVGSQEGR